MSKDKFIYIFKTGSTFPHIKKKWGDFDDFVIREAGLNRKQVNLIENFESEYFEEIDQASGVIITGSHDNVTDKKAWMENLAGWIRQIAHQNIPILGICFGHQLLAHAFGGEINFNPRGIEIGTVTIQLNTNTGNDLLFNNLQEEFPGHVSHKQSIIELPDNVTVLGSSNIEPSQAVCFKKDLIWGLQFHPEFNADITRLYAQAQKETIIKDNKDFKRICESVIENKFGNLILESFVVICKR